LRLATAVPQEAVEPAALLGKLDFGRAAFSTFALNVSRQILHFLVAGIELAERVGK